MKKIFAFLPWIILTFALPANADNIISRCAQIATNLDLPGAVCDGEVTGLETQLNRLSLDRNKDLVDLGIYLRQLGDYKAAKFVLGAAITHVPNTDARYPEIKLSIANITYAEFKDAVLVTDTYEPELVHRVNSEGVEKAQQALKEYESLFESFQSPASIKAALNWLKLWTELNQRNDRIQQLRQSYAARATQIVHDINQQLSSNRSDENEYRINLAETLVRTDIPEFLKIADTHLEYLMQGTDANLKPKTYSRIMGARGSLQQNLSPVSAIDSFSKARQAAILGQYPELAYRWDASLGKLYRAQSRFSEARKMYQEAMQQIDVVRAGFAPFIRNVQYQSYSLILPIYRDYLDLLFADKQIDYAEILKTYEIQKRAELEYYLQCSQINAVGLSQLPSDKLPDLTIYIIQRPANYEIVARSKSGRINHHSIDVKQLNIALIEAKKYSNAENLKVASNRDIHSVFGSLYALILSPFEKILPAKNSSIVFVIDSAIQNIPLSALYSSDGEYLLQKYLVSYSPGVKSLSRRVLSNKKMVVAGMSVETEEFSALPAVVTEVNNISRIYPKARRLLNSDFKKDNFLRFGTNASILHIASHAVFSSDPNETFILAWDGKIGLKDLQRFGESTVEPLDLLYFSSCDSSKGSPISVLGITGTSLRAGARSTIATQWQIEDRSMANLATNFYRGLQKGQSTGDALRSAQITAIQSKDPTFSRFANWAGVGLYEQ